MEGVDLFLGGHEHGYFIHKSKSSVAIKSGSNFESFNEIILEFADSPVEQTIETTPECDLKDPTRYYYLEKTATYNYSKFTRFQFSFPKEEKFLNLFINKIYVEEKTKCHDQDYLNYCLGIKKQIEDKGNEPMLFLVPSAELRSTYIRSNEFTMGNFYADLLQIYTESDLAGNHGGHFRTEKVLPPDYVFRKQDLDEMISYADNVTTLKLPGKRLRQHFEEAFNCLPENKGAFIVFSRNTFIKLNVGKPPGERIDKFLIDGVPLDEEKIYTYTDLSFPLQGRDGFSTFDKSYIDSIYPDDDVQIFLDFQEIPENPVHLKEFHEFKQSGLKTKEVFSLKSHKDGVHLFKKEFASDWPNVRLSKECLRRVKIYSLVEGVKEVDKRHVFILGE